MSDLIYQVSLGKPSKLYTWCQASISQYAKKVGADYILQTEPILRIAPDPRTSGRSKEATEKHGGFLPIFEKENAFSHFPFYDRIAIIDSDVWIRSDAPNFFDQLGEADFAGVRERDMPSTPQHLKKLATYSRMQFGPLADVEWDWKRMKEPLDRGSRSRVADFHNMGLMLMGNGFRDHLKGQSAREFLARPEFKRFVDGVGAWKWSTDQVLLNWWIRKTGMRVRHLDWKWNYLYGTGKPSHAREAHFVHFFLKDKLPGKGENVSELLEEIS